MDYAQASQIINNINSDDWIVSEGGLTFVYKNDMFLTFKIVLSNTSFHEPWATCHPDPNAKQAKGYFSYSGNVIHDVFLASIDGGRALLPYPDASTKSFITNSEYLMSKMFNTHLDEYLQRSGLTVK
ncbi:hypothetical protein EXT68_17680 [Pectobacterium parmentieri]|uniref:Uncharacterized protein n=1 Tax=Pectobacterium parmentieri TaxID=1905730 RepID=A0A0H3IEV2_PECPM|nr:hypothetical protein [Pectobacterium parmentieri]AFI92627.1 Hypothetical protein W5S_4581 [Pectobacterium parmentieri]MBI0472219.1 hypothetical protein [Pectobacterium parmentieri]MBI0494814.1 hypothetical protein [Pectobacterium parmentieri]MBI0556155.1 hypothetical protein [Pectobacterium parmentieri]MBI0569229.1 hypothetical protein [Pectobacterium parmentieri]